jgi:hypothetical protein
MIEGNANGVVLLFCRACDNPLSPDCLQSIAGFTTYGSLLP